MSIVSLSALISALGIGSILGVLITSFFNAKTENKKMLFTARVNAYSNIIGRVFNLFLEPDITGFKDDVLIWAKLNQILSEPFLLASPRLAELLGEFKVKVFAFHQALGRKKDDESEKLHAELVPLAGEIFDQMRKDVFVSNKTAWTKNKSNLVS